MIFNWIGNLDEGDDVGMVSFITVLFGSMMGLMFSLVLGGGDFNIWGMVIVYSLFIFVGLGIGRKESVILGLILITGVIYFTVPISWSWAMIPLGLLLLEILFLLDKEKPNKKENKFTFTIYKKLEALLELFFLGIFALGISKLINVSIPWIKGNWNGILQWTGYIGLGIIGIVILIGLLYLFIKVNSLKFKEVKNVNKTRVSKV